MKMGISIRPLLENETKPKVKCKDCAHVYTWDYGHASVGIECFHPNNIYYDKDNYKQSISQYWDKNEDGKCTDYQRKWWKVWK